MKVSHSVWRQAQNSPKVYRNQSAIENGHYNTEFMLSHEHIKAAALMQIAKNKSITFDEAAKTCFIDGISIQNTTNLSMEDMRQFFGESIQNAINASKKSLPSFLSIDDGGHVILISILPTTKPNEVSILYNNSIPTGETGKHFASTLVNYLKQSGINVRDNKYINISQDQQLDNCCGLSVASNIENIVCNFAIGKNINTLKQHLFNPANHEEKELYYQNFGYSFFRALNNDHSNQVENLHSPINSYNISEHVLEELIRKYRPRLKDITTNLKNDKIIADLYTESKSKLTTLNIYSCEASKDTQIPNLNGKTNLTYSRIGEQNSNSLIMVQTKDNEIYFDEGAKNKFTGLVFVDRLNSKTGQLLESKDVIIYKNGKVIDFFEGNQGVSRLGQLHKFQAINVGQNINHLYTGLTATSSYIQPKNLQRNTESLMAK
ncbi:hypothetical protein NOVO_03500 [Rickettsiales bacterium Ac37b]|nr:hypothetical protein NOVO_03500 [Rickettsiales bacterium Ac37b]